MQKLNNGSVIMRTTALILGVLFLCVATLDAAPTPRLIESFKDSVTSIDKCENYLNNKLGQKIKLPVDTIQETLYMYSSYEQCSIVYAILKIMSPSYYSDSLTNDESQRLGILEMLAQLGQNMIRDDLENSKRGLGFGMDRGYSAQRAAQHLMGLHAATWAGGPGRKRSGEEVKRMRIGMGMDRGYSGSQAAQYLIGMDAANRIGKRMDSNASNGEPEE